MECPRCGNSVGGFRSTCGVCGFDARAKGASTPGAAPQRADPANPAAWTSVASALRLFALADITAVGGALLLALLISTGAISSTTLFIATALVVVAVTGFLKIRALHQFREMPPRTGGQGMAHRAFWLSIVSIACRAGFVLTLFASEHGPGSEWHMLQGPFRLAAGISEFGVIGAICAAIGMYASMAGAEPIRKLSWYVVAALIGVGVLAGILGISTRFAGLEFLVVILAIAWFAFFWIFLFRGRRLALALATPNDAPKDLSGAAQPAS